MTVESYQDGSESALDLGPLGAGDENRTRTISLGSAADTAARWCPPPGSAKLR